jgi:hypothetical protein
MIAKPDYKQFLGGVNDPINAQLMKNEGQATLQGARGDFWSGPLDSQIGLISDTQFLNAFLQSWGQNSADPIN